MSAAIAQPGNFPSFAAVPAELKTKARHHIEVRNSRTGKLLVRGYVEGWRFEGGVLTILNGILDSSERYEHVTLRESWSFHNEFTIGGDIIFAISEIAEAHG